MSRKNQSGSKIIHGIQQPPHYQELKCAYHTKQNITNFCKCEECLLPVCPTCIKVHADEHKLNRSAPKFEEINKVIDEIRESYERFSFTVQQLRNFLIDIESNKKISQSKVRSKLMEQRKILIQEFERNLIEMQNRIMERIVEVDSDFIERLDQLDEDLSKVKAEVMKGRQSLYTEDILKHIIIYYGNNTEEKLGREVETLRTKSHELTKNSLSLSVRSEELQTIEKAIERYLKVSVAQNSYQNGEPRESRYDR